MFRLFQLVSRPLKHRNLLQNNRLRPPKQRVSVFRAKKRFVGHVSDNLPGTLMSNTHKSVAKIARLCTKVKNFSLERHSFQPRSFRSLTNEIIVITYTTKNAVASRK